MSTSESEVVGVRIEGESDAAYICRLERANRDLNRANQTLGSALGRAREELSQLDELLRNKRIAEDVRDWSILLAGFVSRLSLGDALLVMDEAMSARATFIRTWQSHPSRAR